MLRTKYHEVCPTKYHEVSSRSITKYALHNCLSRIDVRSSNQYVDSETWLSNHVSIGNGTAFVEELTKELMRRSQVAQAHSTTYHHQTNGLVERQKLKSRIRRRATAILRTRLDDYACLGMAERNDVGPKRDQCHDSRCGP